MKALLIMVFVTALTSVSYGKSRTSTREKRESANKTLSSDSVTVCAAKSGAGLLEDTNESTRTSSNSYGKGER